MLFMFVRRLTDVAVIWLVALTLKLVVKALSYQVDRSVCQTNCGLELSLTPSYLRTNCHCPCFASKSESTSVGRGMLHDMLRLASLLTHCLAARQLLRSIRPLKRRCKMHLIWQLGVRQPLPLHTDCRRFRTLTACELCYLSHL